MQLRRDHRVVRALGVLLGIGILAVGLGSVLGVPDAVNAGGTTTMFRLGLALFVAGTATIIASLTITDPTTIF